MISRHWIFLMHLVQPASLVHGTASPAIWMDYSSREPHNIYYYALFHILHREAEALLTFGEWV